MFGDDPILLSLFHFRNEQMSIDDITRILLDESFLELESHESQDVTVVEDRFRGVLGQQPPLHQFNINRLTTIVQGADWLNLERLLVEFLSSIGVEVPDGTEIGTLHPDLFIHPRREVFMFYIQGSELLSASELYDNYLEPFLFIEDLSTETRNKIERLGTILAEA